MRVIRTPRLGYGYTDLYQTIAAQISHLNIVPHTTQCVCLMHSRLQYVTHIVMLASEYFVCATFC